MRLLRTLLGLFLLAQAAAPAQAQATIPDSPAGRRMGSLLETLRDGREEVVRAFVAGSMNDEFQRVPIENHVTMFARMGRDFARAPIQAVRVVSPQQIEVVFGAEAGPLQMRLTVESGGEERISGINIQRAPADSQPAPARLPADAADALADSAATLMERAYVAADTGRMIAEHIRARRDAGAYRTLTAPAALADALTADLRSLNADRHLSVRAGGGDGPARRAAPGPAAAGRYRFIDSVAVLEGNVGYMKLGVIPGAPEAFQEMEAALRTLGGTAAMVLDLRGSGGGSAQMANFIISHFTPAGVLSLAVASRSGSDTTLRRTLDEAPAGRRLEVPLYILIDGGAASASEDIPFVLQALGRATLVGERTAGAGRNNRMYPIGHGLTLSVSITRVWDPCTGREWERTGVQPDLAVPSAGALDAALAEIRSGPRRAARPALPQADCRRPA